MEITVVKPEGSKKEEDSVQSMSKDKELADESSLSKRIVKRANPKDLLLLHTKKSQSGESCIQKSFIRCIHGLDTRIPKHIICLDEKYLRHCLEGIYVSALKSGSYDSHDNLGSSKMPIFSDGSSIRTTYACNLANFLTDVRWMVGWGMKAQQENGSLVLSLQARLLKTYWIALCFVGQVTWSVI